jgi:hypothetical protein
LRRFVTKVGINPEDDGWKGSVGELRNGIGHSTWKNINKILIGQVNSRQKKVYIYKEPSLWILKFPFDRDTKKGNHDSTLDTYTYDWPVFPKVYLDWAKFRHLCKNNHKIVKVRTGIEAFCIFINF